MGPAKPSDLVENLTYKCLTYVRLPVWLDLILFIFCEIFVNFAKLLTIFTNNLVVLGDCATKSKNMTANIQYEISVQGMLQFWCHSDTFWNIWKIKYHFAHFSIIIFFSFIGIGIAKTFG